MVSFIASLIFLIGVISDFINKSTSFTIILLSSSILSIISTKLGIPKLKKLKLKQIIRIEGPKKHYEKLGTPTMGGLLVVPIGLIIGNLINLESPNYNKIVAISILIFSYMLIGFLDDWRSLVQKTNKGISARNKLILQSMTGILFLIWSYLEGWIDPTIYLYSSASITIGILIWPLALFVFLAESNATNLTDGLDGLASGCAALVFSGLALQLILRENNFDPAIANFCMAMAGIWLGFLTYNKNPAEVFMGDTGSLSIGAGLTGIALISNSLWALLIMGGVFIAESLSVILQVSIFKLTRRIHGKGKRLFLMAPLHHHFELKGAQERNIVKTFWIITIFLICVGIFLRSRT